MTFYKIPLIDDELDIDWEVDSFSEIVYGDQFAFCRFNDGQPKSSWIEITEDNFIDEVSKITEIKEELSQDQIQMRKLNDLELAQIESDLKREDEYKNTMRKLNDIELISIENGLGGI